MCAGEGRARARASQGGKTQEAPRGGFDARAAPGPWFVRKLKERGRPAGLSAPESRVQAGGRGGAGAATKGFLPRHSTSRERTSKEPQARQGYPGGWDRVPGRSHWQVGGGGGFESGGGGHWEGRRLKRRTVREEDRGGKRTGRFGAHHPQVSSRQAQRRCWRRGHWRAWRWVGTAWRRTPVAVAPTGGYAGVIGCRRSVCLAPDAPGAALGDQWLRAVARHLSGTWLLSRFVDAFLAVPICSTC